MIHFDYPFRFSSQTKHVAEVDQDSIDDISNGVIVALVTNLGFRPEVLNFGVPDQVFNLQPLSLDDIAQAVETSEPRAVVALDQIQQADDPLVVRLKAAVSIRKVV